MVSWIGSTRELPEYSNQRASKIQENTVVVVPKPGVVCEKVVNQSVSTICFNMNKGLQLQTKLRLPFRD